MDTLFTFVAVGVVGASTCLMLISYLNRQVDAFLFSMTAIIVMALGLYLHLA